MIVEIPFRYEVTGLKHGNSRTKDYQMWETLSLEIRELSPFEAPVAVSWDDRFPEDILLDAYARREWGPHSREGSAHTVFFDGSHWEALNGDAGIRNPDATAYDPYTLDDVIASFTTREECPLFGLYGLDSRARKTIIETDNDGHSVFSHVKHSDRRNQREYMRRRVEGLISLNGRIYRKCDEPKLWLMMGTAHQDRTSAGERHRVAALRIETNLARRTSGRPITPEGRHWFSLSEIDDLNAYATEYNEARRTALATAMTAHNQRAIPIVHFDHAVDEHKHYMARVAEAATDFLKVAKDMKIGSLPRETVYLLLELEGQLAAISDHGIMSAFEDTASRLHREVRDPRHLLKDGLRYLDRLAELLDSRDIDVAISAPQRRPS